ncbi:Methyltransferase type 11 [Imhoffiella purpurea]|uniref:Methyltransferase type 11 n=2 Tax=Imhoffiella purpurea TaxID=1249627 RepID=W9VFZ5_9GAMM|nr:Methyltransferase type 11 [Imhoffiella purpurea]
MLGLSPGQHVLDVGCGPGIDTLAMAEPVGADGRVLGVDADPAMVEAANARAHAAGLAGRVHHQTGDACALALDTDSVDVCRCERLFIHLDDPARALREMQRVVRPEGRILVVDSDWGSLSIDTQEIEVERKLARFRSERLLSNGYSGRQLFRLFKTCGMTDIEIQVLPVVILGDTGLLGYLTKLDEVERDALEAGAVTRLELDRWRLEQEEAARKETGFGCMSMVLALGRVEGDRHGRG